MQIDCIDPLPGWQPRNPSAIHVLPLALPLTGLAGTRSIVPYCARLVRPGHVTKVPLGDGGAGCHRTALRLAPSSHLELVVELVRHHVDVAESVEQPDDPDFAEIYGDSVYITPRLARRLWTAALFCADTWRHAGSERPFLVEDLPPVAWPHAVGAWYERFVDCFDALADRIALRQIAEDEITTCTGEEMALHLVIDVAEREFDSGFDSDAEALDPLPDRGAADTAFERARDVLLRDDDVLMLYDASLDGIDDPDNEIAAVYRVVNLHPSEWFLPFHDPSS